MLRRHTQEREQDMLHLKEDNIRLHQANIQLHQANIQLHQANIQLPQAKLHQCKLLDTSKDQSQYNSQRNR